MRVAKERIQHLADNLIERLLTQGFMEVTADKKLTRAALEKTITQELAVEDRLNAEIRQLMKTYEKEIEQGRVDYQKMFTMIKQKLVRERGVVL